MKKYPFLLLLLLICTQIYAQQDAQYTQFMFNKLVYNPGYAGSAEHPSLTAVHRSQWVGIEGAPVSQAFSFHTPLNHNRVGAGLAINYDKIGPTRSLYLALSYAYRIKLKKGVLALGLQGALRHYRLNWDQIKATDQGDNLIVDSEDSKLLPNAGIGIYYESKIFFAGLSAPHLVRGDISLLTTGTSTDIQSVENVHAYLLAGALLRLNEEIKFKPSLLLKYVNKAPFDMDVNGSFLFLEKFSLGMTYRLGGSTQKGFGESLDLIAQFYISNALKLGVAYDFTLSEIKDYNKGSYEFLVQYDIQNGNSRFTNPRFF